MMEYTNSHSLDDNSMSNKDVLTCLTIYALPLSHIDGHDYISSLFIRDYSMKLKKLKFGSLTPISDRNTMLQKVSMLQFNR